MKPQIISHEGNVYFVMKAGSHYVQSKMPLSCAKAIVHNGTHVVDRQVDALKGSWYRCVDDKFFFPVEAPEFVKPRKEKGGNV